jgi:Protein of unknown function (DUF1761)
LIKKTIFELLILKILNMEMNWMAIVVAALSTLAVGTVWYSDAVFGKIWMREAGMNKEDLEKGNMVKIIGLTFLFSILFAMMVPTLTIHQMGAAQLMGGDATKALPSYAPFISDYADAHRSIKHGALHGLLAGLFLLVPVIAINSIFERKSWKYIAIHSGYWIVVTTIMGMIVCAWK